MRHPEFFKEYLDLLIELARDFFTISEMPKGKARRLMLKKIIKRVNLLRLLVGLNRARKVIF